MMIFTRSPSLNFCTASQVTLKPLRTFCLVYLFRRMYAPLTPSSVVAERYSMAFTSVNRNGLSLPTASRPSFNAWIVSSFVIHTGSGTLCFEWTLTLVQVDFNRFLSPSRPFDDTKVRNVCDMYTRGQERCAFVHTPNSFLIHLIMLSAEPLASMIPPFLKGLSA